MKSFIVGIAGGSCSGKTTLARLIKEEYGDSVCVIQHDNYYLPRTGIPLEERKKINYDHPDALETELLIRHLKELKEGRAVDCPIYDFTVHDRCSRTRRIEPRPLVIVDGILLYQDKKLRDTFDYKIYVDEAADVRLARRILRDSEERGRSPEETVTQYLDTVKPMHDLFVEPYKQYADMVVGDGTSETVIAEIIGRMTQLCR